MNIGWNSGRIRDISEIPSILPKSFATHRAQKISKTDFSGIPSAERTGSFCLKQELIQALKTAKQEPEVKV